MNWSGNTSKPTRLAEWRSPTKRISTPRSVHPCANYKTTPRKSVPSIKSHPSNTLHEVNLLMDRLIKANHILKLLDEIRIAGQLERLEQMRLQAVGMPDALHR